MKTKRTAPPIDLDYMRPRFWQHVDVLSPFECWLWQQSCGSHGYGQTWDRISVRLAHRVAWELTNGRIPSDMTIDHTCRERRCCNPDHMRLLPNVVNAAMNGNWAKTHCKHGHRFTPDNTRVDRHGHRRCVACTTAAKDRLRRRKAV